MRRSPLAVLAVALLLGATLAGCLGDGEPAPEGDSVDRTDLDAGNGANDTGTWRVAFTFHPLAPRPGDPVQFADITPRNGGPNGGWRWDFGDGGTATSQNPTHTFAEEGTYTVRLTLQDFQGNEGTATRDVTVSASNPPPPPAPPAPGDSGGAPASPIGARRAVVAVVDTGINPYHLVFQAPERGDPRARIPGFPQDAPLFALSAAGDWGAAVEADRGQWDSLQTGQLVAFPGNRIVGAISMGGLGDALHESSRIVLDDVGHGTAVAGAVALNGPDVDIVMVQAGSGTLDAAIHWAAAQPWIDIVSVSWGAIGNIPAEKLAPGTSEATRAAAKAGKLVVVAAGNEPTFAITDGISGPAWVMAVGGADPQTRGEVSSASKGAEVVSDYSPVLPTHTSRDGMAEAHGTSFSAPTVTGTLAQALTLARLLGLDPAAADLRSAAHRAAVYWGPTDYRAPGYVGTSQPVPIGPAPWLQMGWGYLDASTVPQVLAALQGVELPAKPVGAAETMAANDAARRALWP